MNKKLINEIFSSGPWGKTCRIMKLITFMCVVFCMNLSAKVYSQNEKVNLKFEKASVGYILDRISNVVGVDFFYNSSMIDVNKIVSVDMRNTTLDVALNKLFKDEHFRFEYNNNIVVIIDDTQVNQVNNAHVETVVITGTVRDEGGMSLPGVTILVKGSSYGFTTDEEGKFKCTVPKQNPLVLVFSYIGMQKQEITVKDNKPLSITMKNDLSELDEVVVTGIFNKPKESFTGAVSYITKQDIKAFGNRSLLQTISNIDPAFNIRENSTYGSNPNVLPEIQIRGVSSLPSISDLQSYARAELNMPLFIMDGFEVSLERVMDLNTNEVESIVILKDASATSVYGSRGANGVVVITSTKPRMGKLRVSYSGGVNIEIPDLSSYDLLNAADKLKLEEMSGYYNDINRKWLYEQNRNYVQSGVDTYWIGKPVRVGTSQTHTLSLSGGDAQFRYNLNASYNCISGAMKDSKRDNFNGGLTISYLLKKLRFNNNLQIGLNNSTESKYGTFSDYVTMNPYWSPYDKDGNLVKSFESYSSMGSNLQPTFNPLYDASLTGFDKSKYTSIRNTFNLEWDVFEGMKIGGNIGYSKQTTNDDRFSPASSNDFFNITDVDSKGSYDWGETNTSSYQLGATMSYGKAFGRHNVYAGVNWTMMENQTQNYNMRLKGFLNDKLNDISNANSYWDERPSSSESKRRTVGVTFTGNYSYDARYYFDFSYRLDGASSFGSEKRFAPFWSAGLGWTISNEKWIKDNLGGWLNLMRFRYSYGITSTIQFEPYQALTTYKYDRTKRYRSQLGAILSGLGNNELQWQNTKQHNVGLDLEVLNGMISLGGNYYRMETENQITTMGLTYSHGYDSYTENMGVLRNEGWEFNASAYLLKKKDLTWSVRAAFTRNKNTIVSLSDAVKAQNEASVNNQTGAFIYLQYKEGESMDAIYAIRSPGVDPLTGKVLYEDRYGNISTLFDVRAKFYCGNSQPKVNGRFSTALRWKGLSFNAAFELRLGGQKLNQTLLDRVENANVSINVDRRVFTERWQKPGDITRYKGISLDIDNTPANNRFIADESTLVFRSAVIDYDFPRKISQKLKMERLSVSASISDIFYLSTVEQERGISYPYAIKPTFTLSCTF